jgi:hypothetical protein
LVFGGRGLVGKEGVRKGPARAARWFELRLISLKELKWTIGHVPLAVLRHCASASDAIHLVAVLGDAQVQYPFHAFRG